MPTEQLENKVEIQTTHIRWMVTRDLVEVTAIEQDSHEDGWNVDDFRRALSLRDIIGHVIEVNNMKIAGFIVYRLRNSRLHILNLAVAPQFRRRKLGTELVQKLIRKLQGHRRNRLTTDVRESNLDAQLFLRALGFKATKVARDFYNVGPDGKEDGYRMVWRLPEEPPPF